MPLCMRFNATSLAESINSGTNNNTYFYWKILNKIILKNIHVYIVFIIRFLYHHVIDFSGRRIDKLKNNNEQDYLWKCIAPNSTRVNQ